MNCRFCFLLKNRSSLHILFEDKKTLVFLDKEPVNPGHALIIPKKHIISFEAAEKDLFVHLTGIAHKLAKTMKKVSRCKKVGLLIAGFDVPHLHIHVIPMNDIKDVATRRVWKKDKNLISANEQEIIAARIKKNLR